MRTILVATDFSEASDEASKYGIQLAKASQARIILYNAYQLPVPFPDGAVVMDPGAIREEVIKLLEVQSIGIARSGVAVETYYTEDPAALGILKAAKDKRTDIIIAGMKGRGRNFRKLLGSTVTSLARISDVPLIVVPEGIEFRRPQIIGLAYDSDVPSGTNIHFLDSICELATTFHASLYFVKVVKEKSSEKFKSLPLPFRLSKAIRSADTKYDFVEGTEIAGALNEFARHRKIDILAVLPHRHSFFERLFIHSNTRDAIFNITIPLLILSGSKQAYTTNGEKSSLRQNQNINPHSTRIMDE